MGDFDRAKPFEGFLLISDLDGTLLDDSARVSERNLYALKAFRELGGRFTVATGRDAASVKNTLKSAPISAPAVVANGTALYDFETCETLWTRSLPNDISAFTDRVLAELPEVGAEVCLADRTVVLREDEKIRSQQRRAGIVMEKNPSLRPSDTEPWLKLVFTGEDEPLAKLIRMAGEIRPQLDASMSGSGYFDVLPVGANKGSALAQLASLLQIPPQRIIAAGDYDNDIEMLKFAGKGFAVDGSDEAVVKAAGNRCASCGEDALWDIVRQLCEELDPRLADDYLNRRIT